MKNYVLAAGLVGAVLALPAGAEDLLAVYQQAVQNDAQLAAAAAARDAARELKPQALSFVLPNIQASAETAKNTLRTDSASTFPPSGRAEFNSNYWQVQAVQPLVQLAVDRRAGAGRCAGAPGRQPVRLRRAGADAAHG